jgi:outer membrane biosynthesis protein TonB
MSIDFARHDRELVRRTTRRAFIASGIAHAVLFVWLVFASRTHEGPPTITEVTWLEAKDLEAPKPVAKPVPPAPKAAPVIATPKPAAAPAAPKPAVKVPEAKAAVKDRPGESGVAQAPAPPKGEKGRAEGARVAQQMAQTAHNVDQLLAGIGGNVPAATQRGQGGGRNTGNAFAVDGVRGAGDVPAGDGQLRGTGLGAVGAGSGAGGGTGAGRGVRHTAVAIADDGVETNGEGAQASGRDSRSLMATVQRYVAGIRFCYDNALKKTSGLTGKITLQMDIAAAGEILAVEPLDDSMGNAALERCILSQVQGWKFTAIAAGTVRFTLPLVFSPPQTGAAATP